MIYFVPEAAEAYGRLGITGRAGYFASRAAPMGAVTADVVVSTFFNFNPELVHAAIPAAWEVATPAALVAARFDAVDAAFRRLLGDEVLGSDEMRRAAELARARGRRGRPAGGGTAAGRRPRRRGVAEPRRTWCCGTPSRSCASTAATATSRSSSCAGLSGFEALVTHAAAGDVPAHLLRSTRGWPRDAWDARGRGPAPVAAGSSRATSSASPSSGGPNAVPSRTGRTRWRRRPMPCWARSGAPNSGPWPAPGARPSPSSCPDPASRHRATQDGAGVTETPRCQGIHSGLATLVDGCGIMLARPTDNVAPPLFLAATET